MYSMVMGNRLVNLINKEKNLDMSPKSFFETIYYPLFYDHPKYFQWIQNSPFVQGYKSENPPDKEIRRAMLDKFYAKIDKKEPEASIAVGFGAAGYRETTSGQITSMNIPIEIGDIYSTWIGSGLGVGISGGLVLFIDNDAVIKCLYEGWTNYRNVLNETNHLKGNQIETWNGHWLTFALNNKNYNEQMFIPPTIKEGENKLKIPSQKWVKLLFALARKFPNEKLNTYIFNLSQTNTTVGFIQINLPDIKREIEMFNYLFSKTESLNKLSIDEVYNTQYSFRIACTKGVIGLREIEPKDIKDYFNSNSSKSKEIKINNENNIINYNIYISWIIAMLNNKDTLQKAEEVAGIFSSFTAAQVRGKTERINMVDKILSSTTRKIFIENLTKLLEEDPSNSELYNSLCTEVDNLTTEKFPYFLTLVNFKYKFLQVSKK